MKLKKKCFCGGSIILKKETKYEPDTVVNEGYYYTVILYRYCDECGLMYKGSK